MKHLHLFQGEKNVISIKPKQELSQMNEFFVSATDMNSEHIFSQMDVSGRTRNIFMNRGHFRKQWGKGTRILVTKTIKYLSLDSMTSSEIQLIAKVLHWAPTQYRHPELSGEAPWWDLCTTSLSPLLLIPSDTIAMISLLASCRSPSKCSHTGATSCKLYCLPNMWVAGQPHLLRSHSENSAIQAVSDIWLRSV